MRKLFIIGAGGHAREVFQLILDINLFTPQWEVIAFVVESAFHSTDSLYDRPVLSGISALRNEPDAQVVIAIGASDVRQRIAESIRPKCDNAFATLTHPGAWIADRTNIGPGTQIFAGSIINTDVRIGAHVIVNAGGKISHDTTIGDYATLGPGVTLCGRVRIDPRAELGASVTVTPNRTIGANCIVGAGAVVVSDFAPGVTAVGVPAKSQARKNRTGPEIPR